MGKLVLYLADGATVDYPLDKERITIGRRADNDVCLPYPAVSGEHAQVVTILADSFLEDLGSTNGTIVNGRPVVKHFLADHDQIDIGRQRLTYMSNNDARVDPLPPDMLRHQLRGLTDKVQPARPLPQVEVPRVGDHRLRVAPRGAPLVADLERDAGLPKMTGPITRSRPVKPRVDADVPRPAAEPAQPAPVVKATPSPALERPALIPAPVAAKPPLDGPAVRVLSGASQGRNVPFPGPELTVGRVGVQVAVVRKVAAGFILIPIEGKEPPRINGSPIAPEGSPLHPGDTFEVAGVRLELSVEA
ncbi:MAG: FHA domain-containing protein [Burkholderiales bacterium]|nr:FHA domain-containing protein [Burkholderiales bacterium]